MRARSSVTTASASGRHQATAGFGEGGSGSVAAGRHAGQPQKPLVLLRVALSDVRNPQ
jgi:hypothetical protein